MSFWNKKRVLVAGGAGFIGSHLVELLAEAGARVTVADNLQNGNPENLKKVKKKIKFLHLDLRKLVDAERAVKGQEIVFNLTARVAGIGYNINHHATMFRDNVLVNLNLLDAAREAKVERFLITSSACIYPRLAKVPTPEKEGFVSDPEPTNYGYGWAKRVAEVAGKTYAEEFGMKIGITRPYNVYGPRDHFDPKVAHVIPALIKRVMDGEDPLVVWGSGSQSRSFIYVTDVARGMLEVMEKYPVADPLNLGSNEEIKIKDLVKLIIKLSGKNPKVVFDKNKPEGHLRRAPDIKKMRKKVGFKAKVKLKEGLWRTIQWYKEHLLS